MHRKLGLLSLLLVPVMAYSGVLVGYENSVRKGSNSLLIASSINVAVFLVFYVAALMQRKVPQWHKRLMVFACLAIMMPAFARIVYIFNLNDFAVLPLWLACIAAILIHDKRVVGRITPASWLGLAICAIHLTLLIMLTAPE